MEHLLLLLMHAQREVLLDFYSCGIGANMMKARLVGVLSSVTVLHSHGV